MTIRVAVLGAHGRMGQTAVAAIAAMPDARVVAQLGRTDPLERMLDATHAVDLTVPEATERNARFAVAHGLHTVVGTTGWDAERLSRLRELAAEHPETGVLIAPNFALGAVLAMRFAAQAAALFESAEIIELHHPDKVDAPSGTAQRTAELLAAARDRAGTPASPDATRSDPAGARGADVAGVRVHSVRLRGLVAHQEVLLGNPGEQLTIRHDSFDRASFAPGIQLALREVATHPGVTVGLEHFLPL